MKINHIYTNEETISEIKKFYEENGYVQLENFIDGILPNFDNINFEKIYLPTQKSLKTCKDFMVGIDEINNFIREITDEEPNELSLNQYEHKDFIILSDKTEKEDTIDIVIDFTQDWEKEFGGTLTYTTKREEIFYLEPGFNTLTIVKKPKEVMKYLKYINNKSQNRKIIRLES